MAPPALRTFLVECYVPGLDEPEAATLSVRLRGAADELRRQGLTIEWLRSFALLEEETYIWIVAAANADDIALVNAHARVSGEHVVEVIPHVP